ncbi:hypothetical protein M408DRAFT_329012 [Serendipita vermifera MAFF 305830]|uniref:Uncharacterized protein n=1 Tax=Serendipita vermifera MAFF 305830 TaxID=933852 RepID=A0A0C2XIR6_SERVB|nr:hypothetical protein M408DRAFT_329012 [Serendipita vermifera MAFF 305830]
MLPSLSLPSQEELEEYLAALSDYAHTVHHQIQDVYHRLASDIQRHGPYTVPGLTFEIPAPAPVIEPPAPPLPWYQLGFIEDDTTRRRVAIAAVAGVGLSIGLGSWTYLKIQDGKRKRKDSIDRHKMRKEVVVVLGGDTLVGPALVHALEKRGYVVIASVSTSQAIEQLEKKSKGNVKALVLNPKEPASVPYFHRSLNAALSLRFPLNTPGDPYLPSGSSPSSNSPMANVLVSCISLLSLSATSTTPTPFERLDLSSTYLPLMYEAQITPLAVIQSILPLFRISSGKQGLSKSRGTTCRTSIIALVPAASSRVGVAFNSAGAMAVAGFVKGLEVLRREVDETDVVIVDVGAISTPEESSNKEKEEPDLITLTKAWTASERRAYGPAYEAALVHSSSVSAPSTTKHHKRPRAPRRRPTDIDEVANSILPLIHAGRVSRSRWHPLYIVTHFSKTWHRTVLYFRGYRISVGAGAGTYTVASLLPYWLLDTLLALPATLVSWKHTLMPHPPHSHSPSDEVSPNPAPTQRESRGKKRMGLIEGEEKIVSTAPASTASNDSRRESIGSFEGVAIGVDSTDEATKDAPSATGAHAHPVLPEGSISQSTGSLKASSVLSDGQARTPSVASGQLLGQSVHSASDHPDRITDSWVSLSESTTH